MVQKSLLNLQISPGLLCRGTWTCDEYLYMLGLASEIAENQAVAVDAYLSLWQDYSKSPFTTMARLKLAGAVIAPPSTPTPTLTPLIAITTTPQGTMPTATQTPPIRTITPTATLTTVSGEPYPYPSPEYTPAYPYP
jgi:hypothetical protein